MRRSKTPILILLALLLTTGISYGKEVYSLFGKLFLSGRVEYDFTERRNFLAELPEEREQTYVEQNQFDFDRLFRKGFHSVLIIEETAGNIKNILSLGDVPTTFTSYTFDQVDLSGVRWDVKSEKQDLTVLMVPGPLNPVIGKDVKSSGVGLRLVRKRNNTKIGAAWYYRVVPVFGVDLETNFANYGIKSEIDFSPKSVPDKTLSGRLRSTVAVFKMFRTIGDSILQLKAFRVGDRYDASRSVSDNDDQDRYTDNTLNDPPSFIIPGNLDKNDNGVFDYEDDILLFDVDEDFLDERDTNNNGIRDEEENDHDPNYEFDVGLMGIDASTQYKVSRRGSSTNADLGLQYMLKLNTDRKAAKAYADIVHSRNLKSGSLLIENEFKYVRDRIPDDTWHYVGTISRDEKNLLETLPEIQDMIDKNSIQFFPFRGSYEVEMERRDPLLMQNDLINTAKITYEYTGKKKMVTTLRGKFQYDMDFDGEDSHYEVGIFKTNYRYRPSKSLEVIPQYKLMARNGFKMVEERPKDYFVTEEKKGKRIEHRIRLRELAQTRVRDISNVFIIKTVYQFTKTIKITGGIQWWLYNDMIDETGEKDFVRQAILAELEKSFIAYEKDMFLHIGLRYIEQRAKGKLNDQNFMETFVRVFAKF